ncbi:hypothetical protein ACFE04_018265 [Oxalis oulophora]
MKLLFFALLSNLYLLLVSNVVHGDVGTAAVYTPPYLPTACYGNSYDQFPAGNLFAAVGTGLWDNGAACGRRYRIRCVSGSNRPCKSATIDVRDMMALEIIWNKYKL